MFESAELGHEISKASYNKELPVLRKDLLDAQLILKNVGKFQVIILVSGVDGAGRGQTVKLLNEWMDARYIETNALINPTEEELSHPPMWRFWNSLPAKGKIGIYFGSWYTTPIIDRVYRRIKNAELDKSMAKIMGFEKMLYDEGALILKFWFHLSKKTQKKRLKQLKNDLEKGWRVQDVEWEHFKRYDEFRKVTERALMHSSTAEAPWIIIEGTDTRYSALTVGKSILSALKDRLKGKATSVDRKLPLILPPIDGKILLHSLKYSQRITQEEYKKRLLSLQKKMNVLVGQLRQAKRATVLVFEGCDAAGKGSAIRRITGALDPRLYRIYSVAAPTEDERLYPYLWRFWRHIPRSGDFIIFDRSWYGRVLVERVEKFCSESDWKRAYSEINDFEEQVTENGIIMIKFWLNITKDEQLRRFKKRKTIAFKHFKITAEDWRNRKKWDKYELAVEEMINRTSTLVAPWNIIEANNKHYAHLKILNLACKRLELEVKKI